jgi:hypothetical protein
MKLRPLVLFLLLLLLLGLACSQSEAAGQMLSTRAASAGQTAVAKGGEFAATQAAEAFAAAKAKLIEAAPQVKETAQAKLATQMPLWQETLQARVATEGPQVKETAEALIRTQAAGLASDLEKSASQEAILNRARLWIANEVTFDPYALYDGYWQDGAGLVAYAWNLKSDGQPESPTNAGLVDVADVVSIDELRPGDALTNAREGQAGHSVLFVAWVEDHTRFTAYEESSIPGLAVEAKLTLVPVDGGWTIAEYEEYAPGPYVGLRKR